MIADELLEQADELKYAESAADFAQAVYSTADKLEESTQRWSALANTIRENWRA